MTTGTCCLSRKVPSTWQSRPRWVHGLTFLRVGEAGPGWLKAEGTTPSGQVAGPHHPSSTWALTSGRSSGPLQLL